MSFFWRLEWGAARGKSTLSTFKKKSIGQLEMVLDYTVLEKTPKAILKINEEQENAVHSWNPWCPLNVNEGFTFPNSLFQNTMSFSSPWQLVISPKLSDTLFQGPASACTTPCCPLGAGIITDKIYSYGPSVLKCFALGDKECGKQAQKKNIYCVHISCHTEHQVIKVSIKWR